MKALLYFFAPLILFSSAALAGPNFLIIIGDDCTYNDLPLYGGKNAKTPHLDELASRGLTFNQAYLATAMCQPCRAELYSGQYPMSNGCAWNHSASRPETRSLPHYLRPLGYRVGISGKVHVKPAAAFPFDPVDGFDPNCVRNPTQKHDLTAIADYMKGEEPFCLVIGLVEPHVPWVMGDASEYPKPSLKLPPNLADTPSTREHFANYLAEITYMDSQVGDILETLKQTGKEDDTLVLFTSEQGSQFPGCKWTNWNTGLHTAFIAAWPGKISEGTRTDALIQYADVAPTLVDLAGGDPESQVDGTSFAAVLSGETDKHREFAYGLHNNLPEGPRYPIRSITDGTFRYIRNLLPKELYIEKHLMGGGRLNNPYWATWMGDDPMKKPNSYQKIKRYMSRPPVQLYHTLEDPYEQENLAGDDGYAEVKSRLAKALDDWMTAEADPGAKVDTVEALKASRQGEHLYGASGTQE
ncbi:MAG: sulfatase [Verrucomicrobiales bacterium]|nr:sulfatase [Verrucomicrobiales bacterium]